MEEGQIWVCESGTFYSNHIVCRIAAKPTAKMVMLQEWERNWRSVEMGYGWGRAGRRDKSALLFRVRDGVDPDTIQAWLRAAKDVRDDQKKIADGAYLEKIKEMSA